MDINAVKLKLEKARDMFYNTGERIMSDPEYDALVDMVEDFTGEEEEFGAAPLKGTGLIDSEHTITEFLGTLRKAKTAELVNEWFDKVNLLLKNKLSEAGTMIMTSHKVDGNSVALTFNAGSGKLQKAITRGKNGLGVDLTSTLKDTVSIKPQKGWLKTNTVTIKVEVTITWSNLERYLIEFPEKNYNNPRSFISGKLHAGDAHSIAHYFSFAPLQLSLDWEPDLINDITLLDDVMNQCTAGDNNWISFGKQFWLLTKKGYWMNGTEEVGRSFSEVIRSVETAIEEERTNGTLSYMADGVVIELVNEEHRSTLGWTSGRPNYATALKFAPMEATTVARSIRADLGSATGRVTPVVNFDTVKLINNSYNNVSLANYKRFNQLKLREGQKLIFTLRHDVLGYVDSIPFPFEYETRFEDRFGFDERVLNGEEFVNQFGNHLAYSANFDEAWHDVLEDMPDTDCGDDELDIEYYHTLLSRLNFKLAAMINRVVLNDHVMNQIEEVDFAKFDYVLEESFENSDEDIYYICKRAIGLVAKTIEAEFTFNELYPLLTINEGHCPSCDSVLEVNDNKTFLYCVNTECKGKLAGKCLTFLERLGIKEFGLESIKALISAPKMLEKSPMEFFTLNFRQAALIEGLGDISMSNLKFQLDTLRNKGIVDWKVLHCFAQEQVGETLTRAICQEHDFFDLLELDSDSRLKVLKSKKIASVGDILNEAVNTCIENNFDAIADFSEIVDIISTYKPKTEDQMSEAKTFCVTGGVNVFATRDALKAKILEMNPANKLSSSVSKKTDFLITNDKTEETSKLIKAREFGTPILSEQEFIDRFLNGVI
jgi:NAD-dependent DNA ligase